MSHYSVLVCLPGTDIDIDDAVSRVLAPYGENMSVAPCRVYEEGAAEEHWYIAQIRRDAQHHRDGTGLPRQDPEDSRTRDGEETDTARKERRAAYAECAELETRLDDPVTWLTVATLYNERHGHTEESEHTGDAAAEDPDRDIMHLDGDGRAYTWSDYNPESKWNDWRVGGRWSGFFPAIGPSDRLIRPESHFDAPKEPRYPGRIVCDGGPKRLLDLDTMRDTAASVADDRYSRYDKLVGEYGSALPWSHFHDLVQQQHLDWAGARRRYDEQPLILAHRRLPMQEQLTGWNCLVEEFRLPRVEYILAARASAVPCYATIGLTGEWAAPGRVGWRGVPTDAQQDHDAYQTVINSYVDELPADTLLVVVDCQS